MRDNPLKWSDTPDFRVTAVETARAQRRYSERPDGGSIRCQRESDMCIEVLAHRGLWTEAGEKNSIDALVRALERGFGVETDVRDCAGRLVIAHDPPDASATDFADLCRAYTQIGSTATLAVNVKSDGVAELLRQTLAGFGISNYFVFDMSIPDALDHVARGLPLFARQSEIEPHVSLYEDCAGVWLDAFRHDWFDASHILEHLEAGKDVCVVSPELHRRPHLAVWNRIRQVPLPPVRRLMLCTDFPEQFARADSCQPSRP